MRKGEAGGQSGQENRQQTQGSQRRMSAPEIERSRGPQQQARRQESEGRQYGKRTPGSSFDESEKKFR